MNLVIVIIRVHQSLHICNYNVSEVRNCVILDFSSFAFEMHYIVTVTPCFPLENSDVRHSVASLFALVNFMVSKRRSRTSYSPSIKI